MAIHAEVPLVSLQLWPVDPDASIRAPWALNEVFAGHFRAGSDGGQSSNPGEPGFESRQYDGQKAFTSFDDRLQFVRFTRDGLIKRGVGEALACDPNLELCGLTVRLRDVPLQNRMNSEALGALAPQSPAKAPVLLWQAEQGGHWETVIPARAPLCAGVHHLDTLPNQAVKIKTVERWPQNAGFRADFDLDGTAYGHQGEQALRLSWGDKWSIVFGGQGAQKFPTLERRKTGEWATTRVLNAGVALDANFWRSSHELVVARLGGRLSIALDGVEYWVQEFPGDATAGQAVHASWPAAPLRLSVWGADCTLQVHRTTGETGQTDDKGKAVLVHSTFTREVPAPTLAPPGADFDFELRGAKTQSKATAFGPLRSRLHGEGLDRVSVKGGWSGDKASYTATLSCSATEAPLLCAFAVAFPSRAHTLAPAPVEVRAALSNLSFDSGDPENLPDAEISFSLAGPLKHLCPGWDTAVLPYRPVLLRAKNPGDENWTTLFRGYLMPEDATRNTWNAFDVPLRARGPLVRLSEPAALVDERFGPLDVLAGGNTGELFGCEAVRELLRIELGEAWVEGFNGNGDVFRFLRDPYPLLSPGGTGFFTATQTPLQKGSSYLPPPFGSDLKHWIDTLAGYDSAVWFFDAQDDCFCYGRIPEFWRARRQKVHVAREDAPARVDTTRTWPLLSSLRKSGLLEKAPNDVRVWSVPAPGAEGRSPALMMGRAGDADPHSLDPLSRAQSWTRTLLEKPDFVKAGVVPDDYAQRLAFHIWQSFEGRPPARLDAEFETGFLGPRWGELLHLPTGFAGPRGQGAPEDWMILKVNHKWNFNGDANRFSTTLTARTLSALEERED